MSDEYDDAGEALYTEADVQAAAELARAQASEVYRVALRVGALGGLSADVVLKALEPVAAAVPVVKAFDESKPKRDHGKFAAKEGDDGRSTFDPNKEWDDEDPAWFSKAAAHAPAGGVTVQGKEYRGGEFIPGDVMANATDAEKEAVEGKGGEKESGGKEGGDAAGGEASSGARRERGGSAKRIEAIRQAAAQIEVTDDPLEDSAFDADEVEDSLSPETWSRMDAALEESRSDWVESELEDYDPDEDVDEGEVAAQSDWSENDIKRKAESLLRKDKNDMSDESYEAAGEAIEEWWRGMNSGGPDALDSLADALDGHPEYDFSDLANAVRELKDECESDVDSKRDEMRDGAKESKRAALEKKWFKEHESAEKEKWLRGHWERTSDGTGEPELDRWGKDSAGDDVFAFETSGGAKYRAEVYNDERIPQLVFQDAKGSVKVTGAGGAHEVFSKMSAASSAYVSKKQPPALYFSAAEESRAGLYDKLVRTISAVNPEYVALAVPFNQKGKAYMVVRRDKLDEYRPHIEAKAGSAQVETLVKAKGLPRGATLLKPSTHAELEHWHAPEAWSGTAADFPSHTPAELLAAAVGVAQRALADGTDPEDALHALYELAHGDTVQKAWDESKVKRDHGKFSSTGGSGAGKSKEDRKRAGQDARAERVGQKAEKDYGDLALSGGVIFANRPLVKVSFQISANALKGIAAARTREEAAAIASGVSGRILSHLESAGPKLLNEFMGQLVEQHELTAEQEEAVRDVIGESLKPGNDFLPSEFEEWNELARDLKDGFVNRSEAVKIAEELTTDTRHIDEEFTERGGGGRFPHAANMHADSLAEALNDATPSQLQEPKNATDEEWAEYERKQDEESDAVRALAQQVAESFVAFMKTRAGEHLNVYRDVQKAMFPPLVQKAWTEEQKKLHPRAVQPPKWAASVVSAIVAAQEAGDDLSGLGVWGCEDGPQFWIDQMDWHDGEAGGKVIAAAKNAAGVREVIDHKEPPEGGPAVAVFNEGANPEKSHPGKWVDLTDFVPRLKALSGPPVAAVDVDGTIASYEGWVGDEHFGEPLPGAKEFLAELRSTHRVLIYTTRTKADDPRLDRGGRGREELAELVSGWLDRNGLMYDEVYTGQGKPLADVYVDDRAVPVPENPTERDFRQALRAIRERTFKKAWTEEQKKLHPRDKTGHFISKDAIADAKTDPAKAKELRAKVKPEDAKKLDDALDGKTDLGRTKRGQAKHESAQKREKVQADRNRARELRIKLADQEMNGEELNPEHLREIVPHLATMTHEELSRMRAMLERSGASFGGKRLRADRVAALTQWALDKASGKTDAPAPEVKPEAESGNDAGEQAVEKPAFSMPPTDDPDTTRLTPEKAKMLAESKDRYGGLNRVYAIRGSHVVVAQVVRASADGETLTLRPALFTQDQQKRMAEAGDDSLYDYKIPTAYAYPARNSTRLKLQSLLDDIVQGATGVRPNREIAGVSVVRLPQDVAGPSILDNLAAKYAKPDTGTSAAPAAAAAQDSEHAQAGADAFALGRRGFSGAPRPVADAMRALTEKHGSPEVAAERLGALARAGYVEVRDGQVRITGDFGAHDPKVVDRVREAFAALDVGNDFVSLADIKGRMPDVSLRDLHAAVQHLRRTREFVGNSAEHGAHGMSSQHLFDNSIAEEGEFIAHLSRGRGTVPSGTAAASGSSPRPAGVSVAGNAERPAGERPAAQWPDSHIARDESRPLGERVTALADLDTFALDGLQGRGLVRGNEYARALENAHQIWDSGRKTKRDRESLEDRLRVAQQQADELVPRLRELANAGTAADSMRGTPLDLHAVADVYERDVPKMIAAIRANADGTPTSGTAAAQGKPPKTRLQAQGERARAANPPPDPNAEFGTPREQYQAFLRYAHPDDPAQKPDPGAVAEYLSQLPDGAREKLDQHFATAGKSLAQVEAFHRARMAEATPERLPPASAEPAPVPESPGNVGDYLDASKYPTRQGYIDAEVARLKRILPDDPEELLVAQAEQWASDRWTPPKEKGKYSVGDTVKHGDTVGSFRGVHTGPDGKKYGVIAHSRGQSAVPFGEIDHAGDVANEQAKQGQEAQVGGNVPGAGRTDGGTGSTVATAQPAQEVPVPQAAQGVGKPAGRFVSVRKDGGAWEIHSVHDDLNALKDRLGLKHFDTQTGTWVKPGARGPVKDKNARIQFKEVPQSIDHVLDESYKERLADRFARSGDIVTDFDRQRHRSAVRNALLLGKPVPPEVLADYPDLAAKYGGTAAGQVNGSQGPEPVPGGAPQVPDVSALKRNPKADIEHLTREVAAAPEGARGFLQTALNNLHDEHDTPEQARSHTLRRLASTFAEAERMDPAAAEHVAAVMGQFGVRRDGKPGDVVPFDGASHRSESAHSTGAPVRVVKPALVGTSPDGRPYQLRPAQVEPVSGNAAATNLDTGTRAANTTPAQPGGGAMGANAGGGEPPKVPPVASGAGDAPQDPFAGKGKRVKGTSKYEFLTREGKTYTGTGKTEADARASALTQHSKDVRDDATVAAAAVPPASGDIWGTALKHHLERESAPKQDRILANSLVTRKWKAATFAALRAALDSPSQSAFDSVPDDLRGTVIYHLQEVYNRTTDKETDDAIQKAATKLRYRLSAKPDGYDDSPPAGWQDRTAARAAADAAAAARFREIDKQHDR